MSNIKGGLVNFQVRVNLDLFELCTVNYRMYIDGNLVNEGEKQISVQSKGLCTFPCFTVSYEYYSDYNFKMQYDRMWIREYQKIGMEIEPYRSCDISTKWDPYVDKLKFTIIEAGDYLTFYETTSSTVIGNEIEVFYRDYNNYNIYQTKPYYGTEKLNGIIKVESASIIKYNTLEIVSNEEYIIVKTDPVTIPPGGNAAITLKKGTLNKEPEKLVGYISIIYDMLENSECGTFYNKTRNYKSDFMWAGNGDEVIFVADENIDKKSLEIPLRVRAIFSQKQLYGYGVVKIGKVEDCSDSPQCDGEAQTPTLSVSPNYANGTSGIDACKNAEERGNDAVGIFNPILEDFQKSFENFEVELCYNSSKNKWQPSIKNNDIKIRAIVDICPDQISDGQLLNSINDIETINPDELCDALYSFRGHKFLPLKFYQGYKKFYIAEVLFQHEFEHANDFQNITIPAVMNNTVMAGYKEFPSFSDAFSSFDKNCEDNSNYDEVKTASEKHIKEVLENVRDKLRKKFSEDSKALGANDMEYHKRLHKRREIQKWVDLYISAVEKRIRNLGIKC